MRPLTSPVFYLSRATGFVLVIGPCLDVRSSCPLSADVELRQAAESHCHVGCYPVATCDAPACQPLYAHPFSFLPPAIPAAPKAGITKFKSPLFTGIKILSYKKAARRAFGGRSSQNLFNWSIFKKNEKKLKEQSGYFKLSLMAIFLKIVSKPDQNPDNKKDDQNQSNP